MVAREGGFFHYHVASCYSAPPSSPGYLRAGALLRKIGLVESGYGLRHRTDGRATMTLGGTAL
jgi:hypothetical protein